MSQAVANQTELKTSPAVCPLDCPDTCSLEVVHQDGVIKSIRGSDANPFTAGRICKKVAVHYSEFTHGPLRVRHPLKRVGPKGSGEYERVSWEEAIELAHKGLSRVVERDGPQAVAPYNYAGPHGMLADGSMDRRFLHRLGASLLDRGPLCGGIRGLAYTSLYGAMPGMGPEQASDAQLIIVWSNNVTASNLHLKRVIEQARRKGAKLVVVDPKRIKIAASADLFLQIRPGTDVVLGYALAAELEAIDAIDHQFVEQWTVGFDAYMDQARQYPAEHAAEICGLAAKDIRLLAKWYAQASPAAISVGNGMERSLTGGASLRTVMALPALAGKFGLYGGGVIAKPGGAFPKTGDRLQKSAWVPAGTRTLNILDIADHIMDDKLDPPIRGLIIYNHNPVATQPDQRRIREALSHPDLFTVGIEIAMTDSMNYADVVLPACGPFEIDDIYGAYGQQYLQRAEPVIPAVGEALPNTEIFRRLAASFGFKEPEFRVSDKELIDAALDADDPRMQGVKPSELPLGTSLHMRHDGESMVAFKNVFPATPSGKIELYSQDLEDKFSAGLPAFRETRASHPLQIITPSAMERTNATFGGIDANKGIEVLEIHPDDAASRSLRDGEEVRVFNDLGSTLLKVQLSNDMQTGVVYSPKGTWLRDSPNGETVNALVPDLRADIADGACFNNTYVEVERA